MATTLVVRDETPDDVVHVRELHARAFDDGGKVSRLVDAFRTAKAPVAPLARDLTASILRTS
jgi:putative acetyltransferase